MKRKSLLFLVSLLMLSIATCTTFAVQNIASKKEKIPILMYHHLAYNAEGLNTSITSPNKFKQEMIYIKKLGYNTIHFKDYISYKEKGTALPDNPIIITFDDGYYSNYQYAYPILKELNMKATISIVGWSVGREYNKDNKTLIYKHFSWEQAKEMYDSGFIDIQHHTYDLHSDDGITKGVNRKPNETQTQYEKRFIDDTLKMKNLIESKIGNEVIVYTYPYGISNPTTEKLIKKMGFKISLTVNNGVSNFTSGLYLLDRISMTPKIKSIDLMKNILFEQSMIIKEGENKQ